jgi:nucleotide-binding universal stress UspA family protein
MAKRILVPVDGSPRSAAAVRFTTEEWPDADVVLLHVIDPVESGYTGSVLPTAAETWYQRARADAEETFAELAADAGIEPETMVTVGRRRPRSSKQPRTSITSSSGATGGPGSPGSSSGASPRLSPGGRPSR